MVHINPSPESGSLVPKPMGLQVLFNCGAPATASAGITEAVEATREAVRGSEEVKAFLSAKGQYADAIARADQAKDESELAAAERKVLQNRPTENFAERLRETEARRTAAEKERAEWTAVAATIAPLLPDMHRRAEEVIVQAAVKAKGALVQRLKIDREDLAKRLAEVAGEEVEALAGNVASHYWAIEDRGGIVNSAVFQIVGRAPAKT